MVKHSMIVVLVAIALVATACAPFVSTSGEGSIQIFFGTPTGARALSDPPFSELPVFSAITIKVSGPGMDPVEFTVDATQTSFTAMVPGGSDRTVELYAPVDWNATAALLPDYEYLMPKLVKAYGATTTIDVVPGQRVTAVLRLEVAETKILLPDPSTGSLFFEDSISDSSISGGGALIITSDARLKFDRLGRLFADIGLASPILNQSADGTSTNLVPLIGISGDLFDIDRSQNRIFRVHYDSINYITVISIINLNMESISDIWLAPPVDYSIDSYGGIAIGNDDILFVSAWGPAEEQGILKLDTSNNSLVSMGFKSMESLGLGYYDSGNFNSLTITDMTIIDGKLYVALDEHNVFGNYNHRGKIVEIDLSTFSKSREIGWSADVILADPASQFYGPKRFVAIKPRRLTFVDEGNSDSPGANVDRVVEVDLDSWSITGILNLEGIVSFYNSYYY